MKRSKPFSLLLVFVLMAVVLSACSGLSTEQPAVAAPAAQEETPTEQSPEGDGKGSSSGSGGKLIWADGQPRVDEQGAIAVEVKPMNLNNPGETLDFEVALNTHSVDLSMDLAAAATLATDTGKWVQAVRWDAPPGGHHVSGTLSFPAEVDGSPVLAGASKLTLTLVNVEAAQRLFEWNR